MTDPTPILVDIDEPVARITINREERRNALSPEVVSGITVMLNELERNFDIQVVVLTGAGDAAFCAGADLGGMTAESRVAQHFQRSEVADLFTQMRASRLPIIARANGHALAGGLGLMLACDLVIGVEDVEIGTPEIDLGLWPFMITAVIQRDVPRKVALEMMLTGRRMSMTEAYEWGIVNHAVSRRELDSKVDEVVGTLTSKSPLILSLGKRSFYRAEDMGFSDSLDYLAGMLTVCLESEDTVEGVAAFFQKRPPEWKGR
ncbi:MAG: enoyl-CoA hydratase-related protein [Actinomycetota bacterium]|nr:enoyl-CoA hydratase-related protein [Actinomycetota bacterium]